MEYKAYIQKLDTIGAKSIEEARDIISSLNGGEIIDYREIRENWLSVTFKKGSEYTTIINADSEDQAKHKAKSTLPMGTQCVINSIEMLGVSKEHMPEIIDAEELLYEMHLNDCDSITVSEGLNGSVNKTYTKKQILDYMGHKRVYLYDRQGSEGYVAFAMFNDHSKIPQGFNPIDNYEELKLNYESQFGFKFTTAEKFRMPDGCTFMTIGTNL